MRQLSAARFQFCCTLKPGSCCSKLPFSQSLNEHAGLSVSSQTRAVQAAEMTRLHKFLGLVNNSLVAAPLGFYRENKAHESRSLALQRHPKNAAYLQSCTPPLRHGGTLQTWVTSCWGNFCTVRSDLQMLQFFALRVFCITPGCQRLGAAPSLVSGSIHRFQLPN